MQEMDIYLNFYAIFLITSRLFHQKRVEPAMQSAFAISCKALRNFTGLKVSVHLVMRSYFGPHHGTLVPWTHSSHRTTFCEGVKETYNDRCIECDNSNLQKICIRRQSPYMHCCHSGACESIEPVITRGVLGGVIFA